MSLSLALNRSWKVSLPWYEYSAIPLPCGSLQPVHLHLKGVMIAITGNLSTRHEHVPGDGGRTIPSFRSEDPRVWKKLINATLYMVTLQAICLYEFIENHGFINLSIIFKVIVTSEVQTCHIFHCWASHPSGGQTCSPEYCLPIDLWMPRKAAVHSCLIQLGV